MNARVAAELELLHGVFADIEYVEDGYWLLIPEYPLSGTIQWTPAPLPVAFHAQPGHPGQAPSGVRVAGQVPDNIQDPANKQPPFAGRWALLSWTVNGEWQPKPNPREGANLLDYALGFKERFNQGK